MNKIKPNDKLTRFFNLLFNDKTIYKRKEWCELLGITEPTISQWVNGETIPTPENFLSIISITKRKIESENENNTPHIVLECINKMIDSPVETITESHKNINSIGKTLRDYLLKPKLDGFLNNLLSREPLEKEIIVDNAINFMGNLDLEEDYQSPPYNSFIDGTSIKKGECANLFSNPSIQNIVLISSKPQELVCKPSSDSNILYRQLIQRSSAKEITYICRYDKFRMLSNKLPNIRSEINDKDFFLEYLSKNDFITILEETKNLTRSTETPAFVVLFNTAIPELSFGYTFYEEHKEIGCEVSSATAMNIYKSYLNIKIDVNETINQSSTI